MESETTYTVGRLPVTMWSVTNNYASDLLTLVETLPYTHRWLETIIFRMSGNWIFIQFLHRKDSLTCPFLIIFVQLVLQFQYILCNISQIRSIEFPSW